MKNDLVHIDIETTGLDPDVHSICEVAWQIGGPHETKVGKLDISNAVIDPKAMEINRFYDRESSIPSLNIGELENDLNNSTLVGMNVRFDASFLKKLLGYEPWHYRLLDIESYAMGKLDLLELPSSKGIQTMLKVFKLSVRDSDHTAVGDVKAQMDIFTALREL